MRMKKTAKRALLSSITALVLCFVMLIGSTFAWFTDTATGGKNTIIAGNLDVELLARDANGEYVVAPADKDLFVAPDGQTKGLWEPGHVEVAYLAVENKGSLALEYMMSVGDIVETTGTNKYGVFFQLSEALKLAVVPLTNATTVYDTRANAIAAAQSVYSAPLSSYTGEYRTLQPSTSKSMEYIAVIVWMPDNTTNFYNHNGVGIPSIEFGVMVEAYQTPYEHDSFDEKYDEDAVTRPFTIANDWFDATKATKSNITSITLASAATGVPANYDATWDASFSKDGSVTAYVSGAGLTLISSGEAVVAPEYSVSLFEDFVNVTSFSGLNLLDVSNVTNMRYMFKNCQKLTSLDLSNWNTENCTNFNEMFRNNYALTRLDLGSGWVTTNAVYMNGVFRECRLLATLDLSSFNTKNVIAAMNMFDGCSQLKTITVSSGQFDTTNMVKSQDMFKGCVSLPGYDAAKVDATYAHTGAGGYITAK